MSNCATVFLTNYELCTQFSCKYPYGLLRDFKLGMYETLVRNVTENSVKLGVTVYWTPKMKTREEREGHVNVVLGEWTKIYL